MSVEICKIPEATNSVILILYIFYLAPARSNGSINLKITPYSPSFLPCRSPAAALVPTTLKMTMMTLRGPLTAL